MPTILDQLTCPTVSPGILRVRATYWRTVADRNERNGRTDQAKRLRANCNAMERQASEMERTPVPSITPPRLPRLKTKSFGAEAFWTLHGQAVEAIRNLYGDMWKIRAPHGDTVLAAVPSKFRSFIGPRGTKIRYLADHRMPAAKFWPGGIIPEGLTFADDPPRETQAREWNDNRHIGNEGYETWITKWGRNNNLHPLNAPEGGRSIWLPNAGTDNLAA